MLQNTDKHRVEHQGQDDDGRHNRGLVLAEAVQGILEEGDLLGLELLVVELGIQTDELKLLSRNFRHMIVLSHFLDPILILGSMKP